MSFKELQNSVDRIRNNNDAAEDVKISANNSPQPQERSLEKTVVCHYCNKEYPYKNEYCPFCCKWNLILKNQQKIIKSNHRITYSIICVIIVILFLGIFENYKIKEKNRLIEIEVLNKLNADSIRLDDENKALNEVKMLISNKKNSEDDWKSIAEKLRLVSKDNPSFQEAQTLMPRVQEKLAEIEKKEKKEYENYAKKTNLNHKIQVILRWQEILEGQYGFAKLSSQGEMREILEIALIRVDSERINEILRLGIYSEAKNAKFLTIKFVDPAQRGTFVALN